MPQLPDLTGLGRILGLGVAFLGAYLFALTVSMVIWTFRDIRSRSRDIFAQALSVVLVVIFNVAGLLLYFILRPRETLAEKYERELAEEAMLQDIEERQVCPVCHHKIMTDYLVCPNCHTRLHKKCDHCSRVLNLKWNVCPFCGEPQAAPAAPRLVDAPPPPIWKREPARTIAQPAPLKQPAPAVTLTSSEVPAAPADSQPAAVPPLVPPEAN